MKDRIRIRQIEALIELKCVVCEKHSYYFPTADDPFFSCIECARMFELKFFVEAKPLDDITLEEHLIQ